MNIVVALYDTPCLSEWILDEIICFVEENKPCSRMDFMFFEHFAHVEFQYENGEGLDDFAIVLMLTFDRIDVMVV